MYVVKIIFDGEWVLVMNDKGFDPLKFDTKKLAEEHANTWRLPGKEHFVKVVTYD